jgi:two-component system, chemotaxis family, chemotaxis protein CheY
MSAPILVVDDDLDALEAMRFVLEGAGYDVVTAANGEEALRYLQGRGAPGLILLDLMMPVMNGWTFLAHVESDPRLGAIPIVVLSGGMLREAEIASLGVAEYLEKPVEISTLFPVIRRYLAPDERRQDAHRQPHAVRA